MTASHPDDLVLAELGLADRLVHASRLVEDVSDAVRLRWIAADCRQHARTLLRHLRRRVRRADLGTEARRGRCPPDALPLARELARHLVVLCRRERERAEDPWLARFLELLAEEHVAIARRLYRIGPARTGISPAGEIIVSRRTGSCAPE